MYLSTMPKRAVHSLKDYLRQVADDAAPRPDADLLRQFIEANDHRAFEILLDRHGPMVLGTARRLVSNTADAEDVFQAAFLSLVRLAKAIRRGQTVPNWLYAATCRIAARVRRRRAVSIEKVPEPSVASAVETDLAWREVQTALDEELARLPERLRSPLLLCYLAGLSRDEAAEQLGWSLGTLKRRLEEGRAALRKRLEGRGIPAAGLALAVLSPLALNATVSPALAQACLDAVSGKGAAAGVPALILITTTTFQGMAMKAVIVTLALAGLGVGIYSRSGRPGPPGPGEAKKSEEPKAVAKKLELLDDPLPADSTMRLGTSRYRQGVAIVAMAVSADGKTAYVVNGTRFHGSTRAFDLATGLPRFTLPNDAGEAVAVSPDGGTLVTKTELQLRVRDARTGQDLRTIPLPKHAWRDADVLAFAPNGKAVATISDGRAVHLIDLESGQTIRDFAPENPESSLPESFRTVLGVAFSPDGKLLASGGFDNDKGNYFARLWEVETGKELRRFMHGRTSYGIPCLAFSPDGRTLATVPHDGRLRLFDVDTGKERKSFPKDGDRRDHSVAFTPDGKTVAAAGVAIHLYDMTTGEVRLKIDRRASHLHFRDDAKTLVGVVDGAVYRWDTATGKALTPEAGDSVVEQILVTPDGSRVVTRGQNGYGHIWDGATGKHLRRLQVGWQRGLAMSPDGRLLAWPVTDESARFTEPQTPNTIYYGSRVRLYDIAADQWVDRFPAFKGDAQDLAFTGDGKKLVTVDAHPGTVRIWDVEGGKEERSFQLVTDALRKQSFVVGRTQLSPDGRTVAVNYEEHSSVERWGLRGPPQRVRLWDVAAGKELPELDGGYPLDRAFSPDGRLVVTTREGLVCEVATGKRVAAMPDGSSLWVAAFSRDGRLLATAAAGDVIHIWEVATWTRRTEVKGHPERTTALAFTPAGQVLSGSLDTTVVAWEVRPRPGDASAPLATAWNDLAHRDAGGAFQAQGRLLATPPQTVRLLAEKIKAVEAADADLLRRLIAELRDAKFAVREAASKSLSELGEKARPALEGAARSSSPEVVERAKKILGEIELITPEQLPQIRAVEVLERIASDEAKNLLKQWASGVKGAVLTEEAWAAVGRLERVAASGPSVP
jgi:RNA polymerase sigma factor (sigma-70 family)